MRVLDVLSAHEAVEGKVQPPAVLVVSIESDGLFAPPEQMLIHDLVRGSEFVSVKSSDGHDGFLLEFEQINASVGAFLRKTLAEIYQRPRLQVQHQQQQVKESVFGEVEDVTRW
jgi:homoserine O-acetyltransferase